MAGWDESWKRAADMLAQRYALQRQEPYRRSPWGMIEAAIGHAAWGIEQAARTGRYYAGVTRSDAEKMRRKLRLILRFLDQIHPPKPRPKPPARQHGDRHARKSTVIGRR